MKSLFSTGIRHMLLSTFFFAVMNFFIKKAANIPAMEVVFFRSFIALVIGLVMLRQAKESWVGSHRGLLLARGIFGTLALFSFFITLREMPLGSAVTIQYLSPIFTTIIAIFILQEKVKPMQGLFFAISFAGILLIKGFDSRISLLYLGVGIFSAVASGFAYNMVRSLKGKEHPCFGGGSLSVNRSSVRWRLLSFSLANTARLGVDILIDCRRDDSSWSNQPH
jgi:drug/metabolite transporter (DMT)-like permease